ncbi:hypothetical protein [Thermaurantiacus sp.]
MIITYRGWHRDRGENRIVDMPIDEFSPRQVGPGHPDPRDRERAVVFPESFYTHTIADKRYSIRAAALESICTPDKERVDRLEGLLIRAKGAVAPNAEHEVDVFLSRQEVYLLFLQAFGDQAIRTLLRPPPEVLRRETAGFDSGVEARKDEADDRV